MHRILGFTLALAFTLLIAVVGLFYVWGAFLLALSATRWFSGLLGETLAAFIAAGLLLVGCLLAAQAAVWARNVWDARAGAARLAQRVRDLESLRRDPALSHWALLAERRQVADATTVARWEARYRELLADPKRSTFAARALEGEFPSDAQIDYLLDDTCRVTCEHLRPLEEVLRKEGAPMRPGAPGVLWTDWALDGPRLIAEHGLVGVRWELPPTHPRDPEPGRLVCDACRSRIESGFGATF